jgi:large subunit ribosomal protein L29
MRADEIRELSAEDIKARVGELEEERFRLRFRSASEPLENPLRLRTIRQDIARLKTILTEKERGAGNGGSGTGDATRAPKAATPKRERKRVKNG